MVRGQTVRVHLTGGAPWGFRLQGGSDSNLPITISKIRRRSKANLAKLEEGDEIVTINGKSCEGITRDAAMTYIDNANESLDVEIIRRETNNNVSGIQSSTPAAAPVTVTHSQGDRQGTLQFKFQAPQFNPLSIPVGPPPKTGVWSPGSQHQTERRQSSTTTYHDTPERRQTTTTTYHESPDRRQSTTTTVTSSHSTPQERTQAQTTHSTTKVIQPIGMWQPNKASTPRHEEIEITLTPGITHDIRLPESPITPISMVTSPQAQRTPEEKSNPSILDDPSLILAGMGPGREESTIETKRKSKSKINMQRPFSYAGYSNIDEDEVDAFASVNDQKRICKKIADLLMFPTNKQAKGARMFLKRRKKSAKWTREGMGTCHVDEYETESMPDLYQPTTPITPFNPLTPQPPPPPPMPPMPNDFAEDDPSRLLFQFHIPNINTRKTTPVTPKAPRTITIEPTNFNINLRDPAKCAHTAVTPNLCSMLAQDLKSAGGRASQMFAKRQKRVEKFVTDESNVKTAEVIATEIDNIPGGAIKVTLKGISSEMPSEKRPVVAKHKTPWEAAMESPYGAVDGAFDHINTGPMKVQVNIPKHMVQNTPPSTTMTTGMHQPPVSWSKTSISPTIENVRFSPVPQIRPKFKASTPVSESDFGNTSKPFEANYNRKPRGWSPVGGTNRSASPATSDISASSDTRSLPSFTDFNPKPKVWSSSPSNETAACYGFQPVSSSMMESEDL